MPRKLEGVPRNQLESLIHELDRELDRAEMLRDRAVAVCERRTAERDRMESRWREFMERGDRLLAERDAAQACILDLEEKIENALFELRAPGHPDDLIFKARKVLEG